MYLRKNYEGGLNLVRLNFHQSALGGRMKIASRTNPESAFRVSLEL